MNICIKSSSGNTHTLGDTSSASLEDTIIELLKTGYPVIVHSLYDLEVYDTWRE